ncbi:MAG TPA: mechanosensitive ion channel family protein [Bdellovibrionales bacterium]|nr:MAG: hypothetical protein A2Z97_10375 [Bdellovibrionales bacterium GWB1_52_6]OFZ03351.1 MAG: hypothetical protein A2X97_05250 [Bdellovibrionales bacterium GWA1_52_35]HAR41859.1 mechanosensitive ion channel family protein [Bdellovibrionales bacterium]HCM40934.1 mechanosensitive ion channel family protein [Bdellovibrionales bacterium]
MKSSPSWIPAERIQELVTLEPVLAVLGLAAGAWVIYSVFLKELSAMRHKNLRGLFSNLLLHMGGGLGVFLVYYGVNHLILAQTPTLERINSYVGFAALLWGVIVFVKTSRILLFEYLFMSHMRVAVPVLLVNLFTLLISIMLCGWVATDIFNVRLTPLLATSAILSLVLGLALQDTLGNLFAGIALQFDKPYEIGDWIEVQTGGQKWVGQVQEISWRATVLLGFGDEIVTISNRAIAQSEVANFAARNKPFYRTLLFKLPHGVPIPRAKEIIQTSALATPGVHKEVVPFVNISELHESWILFKLIYTIDNYAQQYIIADQIFTAALAKLDQEGFKVANSRLVILNG